jgi:hypothetical protein
MMAGTLVLTDAWIKWKTKVLSAKANSVALSYEAEIQDATAFTDGTRIRKGGLKVWGVEVDMFTDESSGGVNATLFADVGSTGTLIVSPTTAGPSSSNPHYTGTAVLAEFSPIGGSVGEMAAASASFMSSGTLSRAVTT